jgi:DNA-directed RNA polymerase specialized sigma24 family protein
MPRGRPMGFQNPERTREIIRLIEDEGWPFEDVGDVFGFSRQRAHQIYKKATGRQRQRPICATSGCR